MKMAVKMLWNVKSHTVLLLLALLHKSQWFAIFKNAISKFGSRLVATLHHPNQLLGGMRNSKEGPRMHPRMLAGDN